MDGKLLRDEIILDAGKIYTCRTDLLNAVHPDKMHMNVLKLKGGIELSIAELPKEKRDEVKELVLSMGGSSAEDVEKAVKDKLDVEVGYREIYNIRYRDEHKSDKPKQKTGPKPKKEKKEKVLHVKGTVKEDDGRPVEINEPTEPKLCICCVLIEACKVIVEYAKNSHGTFRCPIG